jgi:diguanylate cyclase (GGDEF)-like protein
LPVQGRLPRRGGDLERFINLWRIGIILVLAATFTFGRSENLPSAVEETVGALVLALMAAFALALQLFLGVASWDSRIPRLVVVADIAAVTTFLVGCVAVNRPIVATNSQVFFLVLFFVITSVGMRGDGLLSRLVTWLVPAAYALPVVLAVVWRQVDAISRPDPTYGSFRWEVQAARLAMLAAVAGMSSFDVRMVATDRLEARTDPLTGLFNRRHLQEVLHREISRARRGSHPLSVILLDFDGFKRFNDAHGHLEGDRVLVAAASALKNALRQSDVVARYGGDEFVVVLPNTPGEVARKVARELSRAVPAPLSFSVGIGCLGEGAATGEELLAAADLALMRAKHGNLASRVAPPSEPG